MFQFFLLSLFHISLLNAVIIENKSDYVIYAIKEILTEYKDENNKSRIKIVQSNFINAFFDTESQIAPKQTKTIHGDKHLMAHVPIFFKSTIEEFRYLDIQNRSNKIEITNDLILSQHLGNSVW
jgi:hypothetical protein